MEEIHHLRRKENKMRKWTASEISIVKKYYYKIGAAKLAKRLKRSTYALWNMVFVYDLSKKPHVRWSKAEDRYLRLNYGRKTAKAIAHKLHRSVKGVENRVVRLKLSVSNKKQKRRK